MLQPSFYSVKKTRAFSTFNILIALCFFGQLTIINAHNGKVAHVYSVKGISIDGDLSDWPVEVQVHPIANYLFGYKPENEGDLNASLRLGYNLTNQSLYIAAEVVDDSYTRSPDNPQWFLQDMQTVHLDAEHSKEGSGVVGYELCADTAYIVHQTLNTWTPQVKNATWDDVEIKIKRNGNKTIYEWRIFLGRKLALNKTIGFDYMVIDKDGQDRSNFIVWGLGNSTKHDNHHKLGDLILLPPDAKTASIKGQLEWEGEAAKNFPERIRLSSTTKAEFWVQAKVDSTGSYTAELPAGEYKISLLDELVFQWEKTYRATTKKPMKITLKSGESRQMGNLAISKINPPDLIPSKGLLHDFDQEKTDLIDQFISSNQEYYGIPGVSLALIKDSKMVYHKTYGVQNAMSKEPVIENTLFEAASITKTVFAYVVHRLVEKGIIDLDKPLHEYLVFDELEGNEEYKLMTGRHVLRHLTGLPNWGRQLNHKPGTTFGYSGEGFEYLQRVVVKVTGKDIEQVIKEELIDPEGLYNMHFSANEALRKVACVGHYNQVPIVSILPSHPGMASTMHTEAKAFSKFALHLLEKKGLQASTYEEIMQLYNEWPPRDGQAKSNYRDGMGQGFNIRESPFGKVFGHSGNNGDFHCNFEIYDELKMGYIIFTNADTGLALHMKLAEFLVEGKKDKIAMD